MKTAVIKTGGKQYVVHEGDTVTIDRMKGDEGAKVEFSEVLLAATEKTVKIGTPLIDGASVEGEIVRHGRHEKVTGVKMKPKKRNVKYFGHKQHLTVVKIDKISTK